MFLKRLLTCLFLILALMLKNAGEKEDKGSKIITSDDEFYEIIQQPGSVIVLDVYSSWAGPCEPMQPILKKLKQELGTLINFYKVQSDQITVLTRFRNKSSPFFLIYGGGVLTREVKGANAPLLEKNLREVINTEKNGEEHVPLYPEDGIGGRGGVGTVGTNGAQTMVDPSKSRTVNNRHGSSFKKIFIHDNDERTLAIVKPDAIADGKFEEIKKHIYKNGFQIIQQKEFHLTPEKAAEFYQEHENDSFFQDVVNFMSSGPIQALVLSRENAVALWNQLIGDSNPKLAKENDSKSLRGLFGTDNVKNALHASKSVEAAAREIKFFYPNDVPVIQRTLAIIKPDLVSNGKAAEVLETIRNSGFSILAQEQLQFNTESASGFYVTHRSKPYFDSMISWLCSGPVIALVLEKENAVADWRDLMGPTSPQVAREISPNSIRARYGSNDIQNGVHGSKTLDYAAIEIEYMFPNQVFASPDHANATAAANPASDPAALATISEGAAAAQQPVASVSSEEQKAPVVEPVPTPAPAPAETAAPEPAKTEPAPTVAETPAAAVTEATPVPEPVGIQRTYAMIKPDAVSHGKAEEIISLLQSEGGFTVINRKNFTFTPELAAKFYGEHEGKPFYEDLMKFMTSGECVGLVLERDNAILGWRAFIGPTNVEKAKETAPNSIRAKFGTDGTSNAVHGSDSVASAEREIKLIFEEAPAEVAAATDSKTTMEQQTPANDAPVAPAPAEASNTEASQPAAT